MRGARILRRNADSSVGADAAADGHHWPLESQAQALVFPTRRRSIWCFVERTALAMARNRPNTQYYILQKKENTASHLSSTSTIATEAQESPCRLRTEKGDKSAAVKQYFDVGRDHGDENFDQDCAPTPGPGACGATCSGTPMSF